MRGCDARRCDAVRPVIDGAIRNSVRDKRSRARYRETRETARLRDSARVIDKHKYYRRKKTLMIFLCVQRENEHRAPPAGIRI